MTTPAHDAPLVFPSVAFRPMRLLAICVVLTGVATLAAGLLGHVMVGVFFGVGLVLGLLNAVLVQRSVDAITAEAHPLKRKMALNSATRLLLMTVVGLTIAFIFRPQGLGVVFGMALFQVVLVISTALPVMKKLRAGAADGLEGEATQAMTETILAEAAIEVGHHETATLVRADRQHRHRAGDGDRRGDRDRAGLLPAREGHLDGCAGRRAAVLGSDHDSAAQPDRDARSA